MDELVIDEKKYVSTKRAAKETGYAKDYVGQLCREGRVPARLVGRSWYVLEAAIKDHRFGAPIQEEVRQKTSDVSPSILPTWEAPRYSSVDIPELPTVNRLKNEQAEIPAARDLVQESSVAPPADLHEAWQEWFSMRQNDVHEVGGEEAAKEDLNPAEASSEERSTVPEIPSSVEPEAQFVPIHPMSSGEALRIRPMIAPVVREEQKERHRGEPRRPRRTPRIASRLLLSTGVVAAVALLAIAAMNSGYADKYVQSFSQASVISGLSVYNK